MTRKMLAVAVAAWCCLACACGSEPRGAIRIEVVQETNIPNVDLADAGLDGRQEPTCRAGEVRQTVQVAPPCRFAKALVVLCSPQPVCAAQLAAIVADVESCTKTTAFSVPLQTDCGTE